MEFWLYFPMSERDDKNLAASHLDVHPLLREAILGARRLGRGVEVKNFPECLLGDRRGALYNAQPQLFIDDAFWTEFERNGFYQCAHRKRSGSRQCLGLDTAYGRKYGGHEDRLTPLDG